MYVCNTLAPFHMVMGRGWFHPPPFNLALRHPAPSLLIIILRSLNHCPSIAHYLHDVERL